MAVSELFIELNKIYGWISREVFCNIHSVWYCYKTVEFNKMNLYEIIVQCE
jgi:desulfoferrodoxin (superoxide reductase-like protein)